MTVKPRASGSAQVFETERPLLHSIKRALHPYIVAAHPTQFSGARTHLNRGGSMGSFDTSTILMIRCLAPELNAMPCCDGVYLKYEEQHGQACHLQV